MGSSGYCVCGKVCGILDGWLLVEMMRDDGKRAGDAGSSGETFDDRGYLLCEWVSLLRHGAAPWRVRGCRYRGDERNNAYSYMTGSKAFGSWRSNYGAHDARGAAHDQIRFEFFPMQVI